jgi:molecular chaperone GrpE
VNHEETTHIDDTQQADTEKPQTTQGAAVDSSAELTAAHKQAKEYLEALQRERADFNNYKRRSERELRDMHSNATNATLVTLLPVIDDFERGMASLPPELRDNPWVNGVLAIQRKFQKVLDEHNITVIDPVGEVFDPSRHEAIGTDTNTDVAVGHVTATLQKGYMSGERVLRPALVRVAG